MGTHLPCGALLGPPNRMPCDDGSVLHLCWYESPVGTYVRGPLQCDWYNKKRNFLFYSVVINFILKSPMWWLAYRSSQFGTFKKWQQVSPLILSPGQTASAPLNLTRMWSIWHVARKRFPNCVIWTKKTRDALLAMRFIAAGPGVKQSQESHHQLHERTFQKTLGMPVPCRTCPGTASTSRESAGPGSYIYILCLGAWWVKGRSL